MFWRVPAATAASMLFAGCASITDGTDQSIVVSVQPREARCAASRDSVELTTFTGRNPMFTVSKGARDILITCRHPAYEDKTARLVSKTQTEGVMSFLFLDLGITDMVTGAMWKYPSNVSILMEPLEGTEQARQLQATGSTAPSAQVQVQAPTPIGKDAFPAEQLAKRLLCSANPIATLSARGPGFETYSVPCRNSDTMMVRCEYGQCRVMR